MLFFVFSVWRSTQRVRIFPSSLHVSHSPSLLFLLLINYEGEKKNTLSFKHYYKTISLFFFFLFGSPFFFFSSQRVLGCVLNCRKECGSASRVFMHTHHSSHFLQRMFFFLFFFISL